MYAVVQTGGKQYRVSEGDIINVEKLDVEPGSVVTLEQVLIVGGDNGIVVGKPYVAGACVAANVVENGKAKKVVIYKYKAKKDSKKKQGHRQPYTQLQIKSISLRASKKKTEEAAEE